MSQISPDVSLAHHVSRLLPLKEAQRAHYLGDLDENTAGELRELLAFESTSLDLSQLAGVAVAQEILRRDPPRVLGRWKIERPLGHGGMGSVYLATRRELDVLHTAAAKLGHDQPKSDAMLAAIRREAQALSALQHGGIARLLDFGLTEDGVPYVISEYVDGRPLLEFVQTGQTSRKDRIRMFIRLLDAVAAAHSGLVLHLDIKPANILVTATGDVKLIDFGLSGGLRRESDEGTAPGFTAAYAAPEQRAGQPVTVRADVYSLGLVLDELLRAGEAPENRVLDGELEAVIARASAGTVSDRYASVADFKRDCEAILNRQVVSMLADNPIYRWRKFFARQWLAVSLGVLALISLGGGLFTVYLQYQATLVERDRALTLLDSERATSKFVTDSLRKASVFGGGNAEMTLGSMLEQMVDTLPATEKMSDRSKAWLASDLAAVLTGMGRMEPAMAASSLAVKHAGLSEGVEDDIAHWTQLALTAGQAYRFDAALEASEQARALAEPIGHWRLPWAYLSLMQTLMNMKRWSEVVALWPVIDAIPTDRKSVSGNIDYMRGTALAHLGQFERAREDLSRAFETYRQIYGAESAAAADVKFRMFQSLIFQGRFEDARKEMASRRQLFVQAYGSEHYRLSTLDAEFARLAFAEGKMADASSLLVLSLDRLAQLRGPESPVQGAYRTLLARVLEAQGNFSGARTEVTAAKSRLAPLGREHPDFLDALITTGEIDLAQSAPGARPAFEEALRVLMSPGGNPALISRVHLGMAQVAVDANDDEACRNHVSEAINALDGSGRKAAGIDPRLAHRIESAGQWCDIR